MTGQTLRERKDAAAAQTVIIGWWRGIEMRVIAVRVHLYGRTSPRPGLCDFDAYGMDIVEGRA